MEHTAGLAPAPGAQSTRPGVPGDPGSQTRNVWGRTPAEASLEQVHGAGGPSCAQGESGPRSQSWSLQGAWVPEGAH